VSVIQIPAYTHAILSPSKAAQWLNCMGSIGITKELPRTSSKYAAEGTVYHDVTRRALIEGKDCDAYVGDKYEVEGFKFTVDDDNAEAAQRYVDEIRAIPGKRFIEVELEYSHLLGLPKFIEVNGEQVPGGAGTGDFVGIDYENRVVHSVDLKFGRGDIVYASYVKPDTDTREPNEQLALYGAAAAARFDLVGITDDWLVKMAISQPRANHYDSHNMTVGELKAWVASKRAAANRAYVLYTWGPERIDLNDLKAGDKQCRWCPLSGNCKAQTNKIMDRFPKGHAAQAMPALLTLDDTQLAEVLDSADEIERYLSAARANGLQRALSGHTLPNWKVVTGRRGNRELPDEPETARVELSVEAMTQIGVEDAEETGQIPIQDAIHFAIGESAYKPRTLKTVKQLEGALSKKAPLLWAALQPHITQSDGKPSLERIEDSRPPIANLTPEFPTPNAAGLL